MVDSPAYPCQFVLVAKLTAVLKDESDETLAKACGFNGSQNCRRCSAKTTSAPSALNSSSATAYRVHGMSCCGSTPLRRYKNRSTAPATPRIGLTSAIRVTKMASG